MKLLEELNQEEVIILINDFVLTIGKDIRKENMTIEILKYLRKNNIKTQDAKAFEDLHDKIEEKYFA